MNEKIEEMISINKRQKEYYEEANGAEVSKKNGKLTNLWRLVRKRALNVVPEDSKDQIYALHREWMSDLSNKTVLELGVGNGSPHSKTLAEESKEYYAIDLSRSRLDALSVELQNVDKTNFIEGDFLKEDFSGKKFDIIYALAVFHHFEYFETFLDTVIDKLAPGGIVITYDPAETWLPGRLLRKLYRPFQTDKDWEWPFNNKSFKLLDKKFLISDCVGIYGKSKYASILGVISPKIGRTFGAKWFHNDMKNKRSFNKLKSCLQVSLCLKKKD